MKKECSICKNSLPFDAFYKQQGGKFGLLNKCKECAKSYARSRSKLPHVREYDRNRPNAEERKQKKLLREKVKYATDPEYRAMKAKKLREYRAKNKHKDKARQLISKSITNGKVIRPDCCERCKISCVPHGHHEDYNKPLEVMWLCTKCHGIRHRELNKIKRDKDKG
jgi:predicted metal-binding protein